MQAYNYGNGGYSYEPEKIEVVLLKVYEDENGNYYLDSGAIRALKGLSTWHEYRNEFGGKETISDEVLLKKGSPNNATYVGSHDPDFSNEYNFDRLLGLYQVTYADIMELIYLYEKSHPGLKVRLETEYINKKEIEERVAREYGESRNNYKHDKENKDNKEEKYYRINTDLIDESKKETQNEINKDEYINIENNNNYIESKDNLKEMFDDIENEKKDLFEDVNNLKK